MSSFVRNYLLVCAFTAAAGALLHVAILLGGAQWYAFFHAPALLVEMARAGHPRAAISCLVIAVGLSLVAAYAFSAAGVIRRLPFLRSGLAAVAAVLLLRGIAFVPIILLYPIALARICDCRSVDAFILATSAVCLVLGVGYGLGALSPAWRAGETRAARMR